MPHVYVLRDEGGRLYLGATADLETRIRQHRAGGTRTTRLMSGELQLVASRAYVTMQEALQAERRFKSWKNTAKVVAWLNSDSG